MSTEGEVAPEVAPEAVEQENPVVEQEVVEEQPDGEVQPEKKEEDPPPIPKGVQKRIDRAVREKYEAQARAKMLEERLAALEQRVAPQPQTPAPSSDKAPTIDQFDSFDDYVAAKAEYIASKKIEQALSEREQRQQQQYQQTQQEQLQADWNKRIVEATVEMPDFEDVIAASDVPMTPAMRDAIFESDVGPKLAYYLASNPDEAIKIANMSPIGAIRALGRIEERLALSPVKKITSAPPPVASVAGTASVTKNPDKMTPEEWLRWRNDQIKKRNAR